MLTVIEQSFLDSPWVTYANVAKCLSVQYFLALEEVIFLLILKCIQQDILQIWSSHLEDHLLEASQNRVGFILVKEIKFDDIFIHFSGDDNDKF